MTTSNFPIVQTSVYYTAGIIEDVSLSCDETDRLSFEECKHSKNLLKKLLYRSEYRVKSMGQTFDKLVKRVETPQGMAQIELQPIMHKGYYQGVCFNYECLGILTYRGYSIVMRNAKHLFKSAYILKRFKDYGMTEREAIEIAEIVRKTKDLLAQKYERLLDKACSLKLRFAGFMSIACPITDEVDYIANYERVE